MRFHGSRPHLAAGLVDDGDRGVRVNGEPPVVVHHRTDHFHFASELEEVPHDASQEA